MTSAYVRASGGPRPAAKSAVAGRQGARRLGAFLSAGVARNFTEAIRSLGLAQFIGGSAESLLAALIDAIAPEGARIEQAAARRAVSETLAGLFESLSVADQGVAALDSMSQDDLKAIVSDYVAAYAGVRLEQELVAVVERGDIAESEANRKLAEVKDFISEIVRIDVDGIDFLGMDWLGAEGARFAEDAFRQAYSFFEVQE